MFIISLYGLSVTTDKTKSMITKIDIKDASIAEEIRKNMNEATANAKGLMSPFSSDVNIPIGTYSDANDIYSGWYYFATAIANVPITTPGFIYAIRLFNTSGVTIQYCVDYTNAPQIYVRTGRIDVGGSMTKLWSAWKKIYP